MSRDLLRELLRDQPDIVLQGDLDASSPLGKEVARVGARFLVTTVPMRPQLAPRLARVMAAHTDLVVLGIGQAGTFLYELRPYAMPLGELSLGLLLDLIRSTGEWT